MSPTISPGDYVVLRRYRPGRPPRPGDVAVYRDRSGRTMIKRLADPLADGRFQVAGDGVQSAPRVDLQPVAPDALLGRVVHVIRGRG